ncbi:hypothetical protein PACTADRAFT_2151 [Pachysolen tannophilus NRRL Y-2460]|uniref:Telomere replication protein EST3 n=1 Tax=Pachysolen tannophilus NRRL Y-2460 TaxID=669874 RepID=A0A1E4TVT4_PACTA|nr:hypothetical protein PACTADRAFT_2151 [Pachysolen tannophilus NRRL Y-2460]
MPQPLKANDGNYYLPNKDWLIEAITSEPVYNSPLVIKNYVKTHKNTKNPVFFKIIKFLKICRTPVKSSGYYVILGDLNGFLILSEINLKLVKMLERSMRKRFTQNNKNVLMLVREFSIKFYSKLQVFKKFGIYLNNQSSILNKDCNVVYQNFQKYCVLELQDFKFFDKDEIIDNKKYSWIYYDPRYENCYGQKKEKEKEEDKKIEFDPLLELDPFPIFE